MPAGRAKAPRLGRKKQKAWLGAVVLTGATLSVLALGGLDGAAQALSPTSQGSSSSSASIVPEPMTSSWTVRPGHEVAVNGPGFEPGSAVRVTVALGPTSAHQRGVADALGNLRVVVRVPRRVANGWYAVALQGTAGDGRPLLEQVGLDITG